MLVSHRKKFIFTKTIKTAGTSVESYYEPYCMPAGLWKASHNREEYISEDGIIGYRGTPKKGLTYYNHIPAAKIKESIGDEVWNSYFKFTVIRNPFSKLVSAWYYFHKPNTTKIKSVKSMIKHPSLAPLFFKNKSDVLNFQGWILNGGKIIDRDKYMIDGKVCVDFFIKYESLLHDLKIVNTKLGIENDSVELPKYKTGIRSNTFEIKEFYNSKIEKLVRNIYHWEFKRFGYEMP